MKNEDLILKWLNGELSNAEVEELKKNKDIDTLEKIAHYSTQFSVPEVDVDQAYLQFQEKTAFKTKVSKVRKLYTPTLFKIAASLVLLIMSSYFIFFNGLKTVSTATAEKKAVVLPDQSEIVLNSKSEVRYNKKKWDQKRTIQLEGEAFFKVSKGNVFDVETSSGIVRVLGTQFNVKQRKDFFEVQCYEGLVSVTYKNTKTMVTPGKAFRVVNKAQEVTNLSAREVPTWITDESSFDRVPVAMVIEELERQYNLVIIAEKIDIQQLFTGSFTHKDKNIALQSVTIPLKISYRIDQNKVIFYKNGKP